jgi:lipopolysaccharide transport system permease protein
MTPTDIDTTVTYAYQQVITSDAVPFFSTSQKQLAWEDIKEGMAKWHIWLLLAYQDIKLRYRRSVLGPFWVTISMAISVYSMGFLYAHLFHSEIRQYYPFLAAGMLAWSLISSMLNDLTDTFLTADSMIKQIKLPYSFHIHRAVACHMLIFFHNIVVMLPILVIFHKSIKINIYTILLIPHLVLIYINAIAFGLILAMVGARYRDVSQIIKSLVQVAFFITPVMWNIAVLPANERFLAYLNPFYAFVELIRAPLLGMTLNTGSMLMILFTTLLGISICAIMFTRYRARIIYWL